MYPDVVSLAYWCRKANIQKMKERLGVGEHRLGRGLAFHIAPANIPVNFAFSFLFSLLAGNGNVVRVPSKPFPQVMIICSAIRRVLGEEQFADLREGTAFVAYPSSEREITAAFSAMADARLIWGGDLTINTIRCLPTKPRCVDLCFADRYSAAIIDGSAVMAADDQQLLRESEGFYNDTYLMDQNACSSPRIIFWYAGTKIARDRFWTAVAEQVSKRYTLRPALAMDKYTKLCEDAVNVPEITECRRIGNFLTVLSLSQLPNDVTKLRGQCGYFYEFELKDLTQIVPYINEKFQTITTFGISREELRSIVMKYGFAGVDRIVPFGSAADIGLIWDGYDIVRSLSRIVALR